MKLLYNKILRYAAGISLVLALNFSLSTESNAQFSDIGALIKAGEADASILSQEYLRPFGEGIGSVTNTGWVNRANPHRTLGFDIQIRAAAAFVPNNLQEFDINDLGLQAIRPANTADSFTPTISGKNEAGVEVDIYGQDSQGNEQYLDSFRLPQGTGYPYIPAPIINASVGLLFDTDVMVRFIPTTNLPGVNGSVKLRGAGLKHGINQYIPGGGLLPFDLSVMGAFTNFQMEADPQVRLSSNDTREYDQQLIFSSNSFNVNALIGTSLPFISVYAGLGYESSSSSFKANGDYPVLEINHLGHSAEAFLTDPVNITFETISSPRAMAGVRFSFLILDLFADITYSNYPVASAGFGVSFR